MSNIKDLKDIRFGRLVCITGRREHKENYSRTLWLCRCDCGKEVEVDINRLNNKQTRSCGCWLKEWASALGKRNLLCSNTKISAKFCYYRRNANIRKIQWRVTPTEFETIIKQSCRYCGDTNKVGVDRIDVQLPYTLDNCAPCCTTCNQAKNNRSIMNFASWVERIYNHLQVEKWSENYG